MILFCSQGFQQVNKKVLLRERKRHTTRCVASPWQGGGTYLAQGVPTLAGGYLPWLGREVPTLTGGVPTLASGVPTLAGMGYTLGC